MMQKITHKLKKNYSENDVETLQKMMQKWSDFGYSLFQCRGL